MSDDSLDLSSAVSVLAMVLALAAARPLAAQGVLTGHVMDDDSGRPVAGAQVEVLQGERRRMGRTVTDSSGAFTVSLSRQGEYRLHASRLGYAEVTTPAVSVGAETVEVLVRMRTGSVLLAPLEVVTTQRRTSRAPGLSEALGRMERGMGGRFITSEQIRERSPFKVTDIMDRVGVVVSGTNVTMARTRCAPSVWVDGVLASRSAGNSVNLGGSLRNEPVVYSALNMVDPTSIEVIEVYPGPSGMPPEWLNDSRCGAIGIWTRRGESVGREGNDGGRE
jgi:5-hydroxyisourate hydrolase-like protein (transthyretin family)